MNSEQMIVIGFILTYLLIFVLLIALLYIVTETMRIRGGETRTNETYLTIVMDSLIGSDDCQWEWATTIMAMTIWPLIVFGWIPNRFFIKAVKKMIDYLIREYLNKPKEQEENMEVI